MTANPAATTHNPDIPDLCVYHAVHHALRMGAHRLADGVAALGPRDERRATAIGRYWVGYAGEVVAHHTIEDDVMFPALVERCPVVADHLPRIEHDHHHLDELMDACAQAVGSLPRGGDTGRAVALLTDLAEHTDEHLAFEDADLLPLFERHFTGAEFRALDKAAAKSLGLGKQAAFTVPFVVGFADPKVRANIFDAVPLPFKILWYATRRRHARLVDRAFGA
ncbi:MAG TPA: hemerythrin domain-containing protein [Acidimicrobiales bacterium]|nr:hemerythrin domain-containing protein [Acidimicrobiales bacterium]